MEFERWLGCLANVEFEYVIVSGCDQPVEPFGAAACSVKPCSVRSGVLGEVFWVAGWTFGIIKPTVPTLKPFINGIYFACLKETLW